MTREEQIVKQAAKEQFQLYQPPEWRAGFISGAKWSDETQGKELMYAIQKTGERTKREIINKACEYLRTHLWQNVDDDNDPIVESVHNITLDDFIKDFKRFLEE